MAVTKQLIILQLFLVFLLNNEVVQSQTRNLGKFQEVFAWKQLTFNINGNDLLKDRFNNDFQTARKKRRTSKLSYNYEADPNIDRFDPNRIWGQVNIDRYSTIRTPTSTSRPSGVPDEFFIQYNNVPMGMERVGDRLFVTIPRRRYGIPATINYIDLKTANTRSPSLSPYPDLEKSQSLTSVYRTRADKCGRLWMVDTGLMEIPGNPQQVQPPAIVVFDLRTNQQILRYQFKTSDIPAANTPTGLASITVDIDGDCSDAYAYVPDLTTFGLIVYSLKQNDSWRVSHNYFNFNPLAGNLNVSGQFFQWSDGIFSITLTEPGADGCRTAYFHPLISTQEFSVSTCILKNSTASQDSSYFSVYNYVGDRGNNSQSTMHDYHARTGVIFYADIGRDAVSCWNTKKPMSPSNVPVLAQHVQRMSYPSDLHVTGEEVWVMANTLPRFGYSALDTEEYNFYIYKGDVRNLIQGTECAN